jgi:pimeloyl-ACP methyl ester carboxylesterase
MRRWLILVLVGLALAAVYWWTPPPSEQRGPELWMWAKDATTPADRWTLFKGEPVAPSRTAVVFIHGLNGNHIDTFTTSNGLTWFQIIAEDQTPVWRDVPLADFDILTLGYEYAFYQPVTASEVAKQLSGHLEESGLLDHYDRVLFVTHSLGGVLTKHMLVGWADDEERRRHFMNVLGVFLIGVPSQGAPLATVADHVGIIPLVYGLFGSYGLVRDLRTRVSNSFIDDLEDDWRRVLRSRRNAYWSFPQVYCAYETARTGLVGTIVPRIHALTECDGNNDRAVSVTHTELVKPSGPLDPTHLWLRDRIKSIFAATERSRGANFKPDLPLSELIKHGLKVTFVCPSDQGGICPKLIDSDGAYWPDMKGAYEVEAFSRAHVLERLTQLDDCLTAEPGPDFRSVAVTVRGAVPCPNGRGYACRVEVCPGT